VGVGVAEELEEVEACAGAARAEVVARERMAGKMVVNFILRLEWEVTDGCCSVLVDFLKSEIENEENDVE